MFACALVALFVAIMLARGFRRLLKFTNRPMDCKVTLPEDHPAIVEATENAKAVVEKFHAGIPVVWLNGPPCTFKSHSVSKILAELSGREGAYLLVLDETGQNQTATLYDLSSGELSTGEETTEFVEGSTLFTLRCNCAKTPGAEVSAKKVLFNNWSMPALERTFSPRIARALATALNTQVTTWFSAHAAESNAKFNEEQNRIARLIGDLSREINSVKGSSGDPTYLEGNRAALIAQKKNLRSPDYGEMFCDAVRVQTDNILNNLTVEQYLIMLLSRPSNSLAKALRGIHFNAALRAIKFPHFPKLTEFLNVRKPDGYPEPIIKDIDPFTVKLIPGYIGRNYNGQMPYFRGLPTDKRQRRVMIVRGDDTPFPLHVTTNDNLSSLTLTKVVSIGGAKALFGRGPDGKWYHITVATPIDIPAKVFHLVDMNNSSGGGAEAGGGAKAD